MNVAEKYSIMRELLDKGFHDPFAHDHPYLARVRGFTNHTVMAMCERAIKRHRALRAKRSHARRL